MNQRIIGIDEKKSAEELAKEVVANMQSGERVADISLTVALYREIDKLGMFFTKAMFFATVVYEQDTERTVEFLEQCNGIVE